MVVGEEYQNPVADRFDPFHLLFFPQNLQLQPVFPEYDIQIRCVPTCLCHQKSYQDVTRVISAVGLTTQVGYISVVANWRGNL